MREEREEVHRAAERVLAYEPGRVGACGASFAQM